MTVEWTAPWGATSEKQLYPIFGIVSAVGFSFYEEVGSLPESAADCKLGDAAGRLWFVRAEYADLTVSDDGTCQLEVLGQPVDQYWREVEPEYKILEQKYLYY